MHKGQLTEEATFELNELSAGRKAEGRTSQAGEISRAKILWHVQAAWCTQGQKKLLEPGRHQEDGLKSEGRQRPDHGKVFKMWQRV